MDGYVSGAVLKHKFPDIELLGQEKIMIMLQEDMLLVQLIEAGQVKMVSELLEINELEEERNKLNRIIIYLMVRFLFGGLK